MKIAVLGDIHGNIEALKVAYETAASRRPDRIYHLGDLGGYAPFVNEVVDFIIGHEISGVKGNYDYTVSTDAEHCGCAFENQAQAEIATTAFEWTKRHTTARSKDFMRRLPSMISLVADDMKVKLFHATPHKNNIYWFEDRPEKFFIEMAEKVDADLFIYGHTHKPYRRDIGEKVFINAGSVGKPKDGDPRTCVVIVEISGERVLSEFIRMPYDIERVAQAIRESELPSNLAEKLLTGT